MTVKFALRKRSYLCCGFHECPGFLAHAGAVLPVFSRHWVIGVPLSTAAKGRWLPISGGESDGGMTSPPPAPFPLPSMPPH